ncbi:MAG: twin-arginine translocation signal domain-containing protein [Alphaproteobacteria bacterium]|nr:twin-arginine translocation signal domain-containing protein [Alphaproteobacteria bacterium]
MRQCSCCVPNAMGGAVSRRRFLGAAALGAGALATATLLPGPVRATSVADALVLSCMDYRLTEEIVRYMDGRGMATKYDHVILAGASLGVLYEKNPTWGKTFWDHVDAAIQLHGIRKVIVIDHRDCGAYRLFLGADQVKDAASELAAHTGQLRGLRTRINERFPKLDVELLLMSLDGSVEVIA